MGVWSEPPWHASYAPWCLFATHGHWFGREAQSINQGLLSGPDWRYEFQCLPQWPRSKAPCLLFIKLGSVRAVDLDTAGNLGSKYPVCRGYSHCNV